MQSLPFFSDYLLAKKITMMKIKIPTYIFIRINVKHLILVLYVLLLLNLLSWYNLNAW